MRKFSLELGDRVMVSGYVSKEVDDNDNVVHPRYEYPEPREGVIAGVRLLPEGRIIPRGDYDDPSHLAHTTSLAVYLVAISRRSVIYAAPDQVGLAGRGVA